MILYSFSKKYFHRLTFEEIEQFQTQIMDFAKEKNADFVKLLRKEKSLSDDIESQLKDIIEAYIKKLEAKRPADDEGGNEIVSDIGKNILTEVVSTKDEE